MSSTPLEPQPLPSPPSDGITCLKYLPVASSSTTTLACTSWDGTVRLYDTKTMTNVCTQSMDCGPLLSLAVDGSGNSLFTGGLDGSGKSIWGRLTSTVIIDYSFDWLFYNKHARGRVKNNVFLKSFLKDEGRILNCKLIFLLSY